MIQETGTSIVCSHISFSLSEIFWEPIMLNLKLNRTIVFEADVGAGALLSRRHLYSYSISTA